MRRMIRLLLVGALAVASSACGGDDDSSTPSTVADDGGGGITVPAGDTGTAVAVEAGDTSETEQFLKASPTTVKAGLVTFTLTNTSTVNKEHEMVVFKTDTPFDQLEVGTDDRLSEADSVGEVSEIKPGTTGSVTLDLAPGNYVLACNLAKHYEQGMRIAFIVE
jgi:uncharacterized cupredoxin-like copper-binding protein